MLTIDIISTLIMAAGSLVMILGAWGIVKLPDFYTRIHAAGKCDTLGQILVIFGCMIYEGFSFITIKLLMVILFYLFAGPCSTHALMKAAYVTGVPVWKKGDKRM